MIMQKKKIPCIKTGDFAKLCNMLDNFKESANMYGSYLLSLSCLNADNKKIKEALLNKALGFTTQEVTEEYGLSGDDLVLQKRKTSTKSYPPDLTALQMILGKEVESENEFQKMTDEELQKEKERLIKLLKEKK